MNVIKIISGGQTGIDRMALEVARELGLATGGAAAKGFMTEYGPDISLKEFGLIEHQLDGYPPRTRQNVYDADGTVLYGDLTTVGSRGTINYCVAGEKPYLGNPTTEEFILFIKRHHIKTLNVAGNRATKLSAPELQGFRNLFKESLTQLLLHMAQHTSLKLGPK